MDSSYIFESTTMTDVMTNTKALFTLPTIGLPSRIIAEIGAQQTLSTILGVLSGIGFARGIPIYASSQEEFGQNNIGNQIMLRGAELGTQVVTDNIAPLPREWLINGYIKSPVAVRQSHNYYLEVSNSIVIVQAIKNYLRYLRTLRAPFQFITREGESIEVLMQNYRFIDEPESEWATRLELHLTEYIALGVGKDGYAIRNLPSLGGLFGKSAQYATAGTKVFSSALRMFGR